MNRTIDKLIERLQTIVIDEAIPSENREEGLRLLMELETRRRDNLMERVHAYVQGTK